MGKWTRTGWLMKGLGAGLAAASLAAGPGWIGLAMAGAGAALGFWSVGFPRDRWTPQMRRKKLREEAVTPVVYNDDDEQTGR